MEIGPVVSSAHLADSQMPELSEVEFALVLANNAFQRWIVRCMTAAGGPGMSSLEVLIVHLVNHRERPKTLADIGLMLNIEDTHLVNYAVRKLTSHKLLLKAVAFDENELVPENAEIGIVAIEPGRAENVRVNGRLKTGFSG